VELRFISEHYHVAPERVVEMRERNVDFIAIHDDVSGHRVAAAKRDDKHDDDDRGNQGNGRGRGNGKKR
jgi:hypothetical protein